MLNPSDCVNNAVPKAHVNVNANIISAEILAIRLYTGFKTARPAKIIPTTATTVSLGTVVTTTTSWCPAQTWELRCDKYFRLASQASYYDEVYCDYGGSGGTWNMNNDPKCEEDPGCPIKDALPHNATGTTCGDVADGGSVIYQDQTCEAICSEGKPGLQQQ